MPNKINKTFTLSGETMKFIRIVIQLAGLFLFYFAGTAIQQFFSLSMPGSIIGMFLLFFCLSVKLVKLPLLKEGSSFLLKHLALLFVPATVGLMDHFDLFAGRGLISALIALFSTALVMLSAASVSQWMSIRKTANEGEGENS